VVLRALRDASGLTQQGWATWLGYSVATVRRWERGTAAPTAEAEEALLAHCQQKGLFRTFDHEPLQGFRLTPELLRDLLAEARLRMSQPQPASEGPSVAPEPLAAAGPGTPTRPRPELPSGTVTFLFTDVEGSTTAWLRNRQTMSGALARHDALIEDLVAEHAGQVVRPRGEGDSRFAVFARPSDAISAACAIQVALIREEWTLPEPLRVRMAIHTGESELRMRDYYGPAVNHCARLRAAAHGGQVLVSTVTADLVREALAADVGLQDLGEYQLKDLERSEHIWQLVHPELRAEFPPLALRSPGQHNLQHQLSSFVGREQAADELRHLLVSARLLTLTGTGGIGKTRLALAVAESVLPNRNWCAGV
jgi:class 3 adenylate cyclase